MKEILLFTFLFLFYTITFSQNVTYKDFRLFVGNVSSADSSIKITAKKLLQIKRLTTNFPWAKIKSYKVFLTSKPYVTACTFQGDTLDFRANIFIYAYTGCLIEIEPNVYDNKGRKIKWPGMLIEIIEDTASIN